MPPLNCRHRRVGAAVFALIAAAVCTASVHFGRFAFTNEWPVGGQNLRDMRNQPVTAIRPTNVAKLTLKWTFTTAGDVSATPAVSDGTLYFPDWGGNFYAVDAATGQQRWSHKISDWTGIATDVARTDPVVDGGKVILGDQGGMLATFSPADGLSGPGARVMAVSALSGNLLWVTQVEAFPGAMITGSPVVYNGVVYVGVSSREENLAEGLSYPCCSFQGSVVALSEATGHMLWQTYVMPRNGGKPGGYSGGAVWGSTPAVDPKRSAIYVATGNNYFVPQDVQDCIDNAQQNNQSDSVCDGVHNYAQDYFDSILALDLRTGGVKWARRVQGYDAQNFACGYLPPGVTWCPSPTGPDYDFGAGPNLIPATINGKLTDLVGTGQKSGIYWALDPDTGSIVWQSLVGPGGVLGGIEWGTATDGRAVYVPIANSTQTPYTLQPSGTPANGGSWSALDAATGKILWQTATPGTCSSADGSSTGGCMGLGPATVAGHVVFVGSMDQDPTHPTMFALSALTGKVLWSYAAGSSVNAAPAVVGNMVYWGSGYTRAGPIVGNGNNKLFAFELPK